MPRLRVDEGNGRTMYAILLPLGVISAVAGLVLIGFGVPEPGADRGKRLLIKFEINSIGRTFDPCSQDVARPKSLTIH